MCAVFGLHLAMLSKEMLACSVLFVGDSEEDANAGQGEKSEVRRGDERAWDSYGGGSERQRKRSSTAAQEAKQKNPVTQPAAGADYRASQASRTRAAW